jgi:hypothetical protein
MNRNGETRRPPVAIYRCNFLRRDGAIGSEEEIDRGNDQDAIGVARWMLTGRSHYASFELWLGERRIHQEMQPKEVGQRSAAFSL